MQTIHKCKSSSHNFEQSRHVEEVKLRKPRPSKPSHRSRRRSRQARHPQRCLHRQQQRQYRSQVHQLSLLELSQEESQELNRLLSLLDNPEEMPNLTQVSKLLQRYRKHQLRPNSQYHHLKRSRFRKIQSALPSKAD